MGIFTEVKAQRIAEEKAALEAAKTQAAEQAENELKRLQLLLPERVLTDLAVTSKRFKTTKSQVVAQALKLALQQPDKNWLVRD